MGHNLQVFYPEAPSGTIEVLRHGTNTPADVFADRECTEPVDSLSLTGAGRFRGYVLELVDCRVRNVNALLIDEWTEGTEDALVAVRNLGFTGTLADGSQGENGVVQLSELLSRVSTSFGADDFNVKETGTTTALPLKDALHNIRSTSNPFYVVTDAAYGAVGDGVTDDRPAIQRAIDAAVLAGGGIIFFPGGKTYLVTGGLACTSNKVSFLGAGATSSIITITAAAVTLLTINAGAATFGGSFIQGLGFDSTVVGGSQTSAVTITTAPGYELRGLRVRSFRDGFDIQSKTVLRNCDWFGAVPNGAIIFGVKFSANAAGSQVLGGSYEGALAGVVGVTKSCVVSSVARILLDGVDISHPSDGVNTEGVYVTAGSVEITNCTFRRSTGAANTGQWIHVLADVPVTESDNIFESTTVPAARIVHQDADTYASIFRGSRARQRELALNMNGGAGANVNVDCGETVGILTLAGGWTAPLAGVNGQCTGGMLVRVTVRNTTGGALNCTVPTVGSGTHINGAVTSVPAGKTCTWTIKYNEVANNWDEVSFATG